MKIINEMLVLFIVVVYTVLFTNGVYAKTLAGYDSEKVETERPYSDDDFYEMSHVIQAEAGYCSWEMMVGVGSVVMNRVKSDKFPNTVYEVIHQYGQYSCVSNGSFNNEPTQGAKDAADYVLRTGGDYPADVIYQANFPQGSAIYLTLSTSYSTMYFCYG